MSVQNRKFGHQDRENLPLSPSNLNLWTRRIPLAILGACLVFSTGCSTLSSLTQSAAVVPPVEEPGEPTKGMYLVDMVPLVGKSTSFKGKIRSNMTVQNVLEESGALKKVRSPKVTVYRIVPGRAKPLTLPVPLQSGKRMVKFEKDYSIHPGDRIVVESNSGGLDNLMQSLMPQK